MHWFQFEVIILMLLMITSLAAVAVLIGDIWNVIEGK
jgi:hypothetical protein